MPFDRGSVTFAIFEINGEIPENIVDLFAAGKAGALDAVTDEPEQGWVTGHHLLDTAIDGESADFGGSYCLTLRQSVRRIPASLLNALCRREEAAFMRANNRDRISGKDRREIREEVVEKNIQKMPPTLSGVQMLLEPHEKLLYVGASSQTKLDLFVECFSRTTKLDLLQVNPELLLERFGSCTASSFPGLDISGMPEESAVGRDFLMFLWFYSETVGKLSVPDYGEFDLMIEAPLVFSGDDEGRGAGEAVLKKGASPLRSAEAKAAISVGKKLKKAKLTLTRDNQIWNGTFDADNFVFCSFKLPEGEAMNEYERCAERVEALGAFRAAIMAYFQLFVESMAEGKLAETRQALRKWAGDRDAV